MEQNGTINGELLVAILVALLIFGLAYNYSIERWPWLKTLRPAEQVVGGVLATVVLSGFLIGWINMLIVLACFVASGLFMLIGSWNRAAADEKEAKKIQRDSMK